MMDNKSYENKNRYYSSQDYHSREGFSYGRKEAWEGNNFWHVLFALIIVSISGYIIYFIKTDPNFYGFVKEKLSEKTLELDSAKYNRNGQNRQHPKKNTTAKRPQSNSFTSIGIKDLKKSRPTPVSSPRLQYVYRKKFWADIKIIIGDKRRAFFQKIIENSWNFCRTLSQEAMLEAFNNIYLPELGRYFLILNFIDREYAKSLESAIKSGFNVEYKNFLGESLLLTAVAWNKEESVKALLDLGATFKTQSYWRDNALHYAARNNNFVLAYKALFAGVPINRKNEEGRTPINFATEFMHFEMFKFLANCGAITWNNIHKNFRDKYTSYSYCNSGLAPINDRDIPKIPLWTNLLIFQGVKTNLGTETREEKELAEQAFNFIKNGQLIKLFEMSQQGVDLSKLVYSGMPIVHCAAGQGRIEILKYLLHEYDCKDLRDRYYGLTALHMAVCGYNTRVETVKLLLESGFDPNARDIFNNTAFHYAVNRASPEAFQAILEAGGKCDETNLSGETPLHIAFKCGDHKVVSFLLKNGADINKKNSQGNTPLHLLSNYNQDTESKIYEEAYKFRSSFDLTIKNIDGKTPRNIAGADNFTLHEATH